MSVRALALAALLGLAFPASAQEVPPPPPDPELSAIRLGFEYGKFQEALSRTQARIDRGGLSDEDLAELHKYAGLAAFNLGQLKEAERHLLALLRLNPEYSLDPFIFPPPAIDYLEKLRRQHAPELDLLRQQKQAEDARRRALESERERARVDAEEQRRRLEDLSRKITVRVVEKRLFLLNFMPFGVGQLQEGRSTLGVVLASSEGALAAASIVGYLAHEALITTQSVELEDRQVPGGKVTITYYGIPAARAAEASAWRLVKVLSGAGFYALWGYGIIDSLLHWQEEVVTTHEEETQPTLGAGSHVSRQLAPSHPEGPSAYVFPLPGGLGAGLHLTF